MSNISNLNLTLVGGTVCWNQLIQNGNFADTSGWTVNANFNGSMSINNNICTLTLNSGEHARLNIGILQGYGNIYTHPLVLSHKYLLVYDVKPSFALTGFLNRDRYSNRDGTFSASLNIGSWNKVAYTFSATQTASSYLMLCFNNSALTLDSKQTIQIRNVCELDLTAMFGSAIADYVYTLEQATAGSGVAWLQSYGFLTKDYYTTNAGTLISVNPSAHKTTNIDITDVSWAGIKKIVSAGLAPKIWKVRDQLTCTRGNQTLTWDILGFDCDTAANGNYHTMTLGLHDLFTTLQFDARQALFYFAEGLAVGTYNFTVTQHTWVSSDIGKTFQFTTTQTIPAGGQLVLDVANNVTIANSTAKIYSSTTSKTAIETVTITEGSGGTSLGDVNNAINGDTNSLQRALQGNNRYSISDIRQFINGTGKNFWTPQNVWDRAPWWVGNEDGFLTGIDEDFLAVIGEVKKKTALNTVCDGGGIEETIEKFFLLSRSEVFGGDEVTGGEGSAYPYYSQYSNLSSAGTGADANRIKYQNGTAKNWWLRTPLTSTAYQCRRVYPSGDVPTEGVLNSSIGIAPACCIVGDSDYEEYTYPLGNVELRGLFKLDENNELYCDGDVRISSGKVTRNYEYRAYQSGDESLTDAITDGTHTVVKLTTPIVETVDTFTSPQTVVEGGTEEFVDERDVPMPVGNISEYY